MIRPDIVKILQCPVTRSPLVVADQGQIDHLNQLIETGSLVDRIGNQVADQIDGGLVNADQSLLLPVRNEIAILVADQAIPL